jgi:PleD family two-component response regulator
VRAALRRSQLMAALNPLTGLPGNIQIRHEVERRLQNQEPLALMHADLDNFKAYNDYYGFLRGDDAIVRMAEVLTAGAERICEADGFVGHVGGDDMIVVCSADRSEALAQHLIEHWDDGSRGLYDLEDVERGGIIATDRYGQQRNFGVMTLSLGIVLATRRQVSSYRELTSVAAQMKSQAKKRDTSYYEIDRRWGTLRDDEKPLGRSLDEQVARRSVLVVDDDETIRYATRHYMEPHGFVVFEAADGIEGFKAAKEHRPGVVILDYRMPELDGQYTAQAIRDELPDSVILALSAYLDEAPLWADGFMRKDRLPQLPQVVSNLLALDEGSYSAPPEL